MGRQSRESLRRLAERWMSLWQGGDLELFDELHAVDFVDRSAAGRAADRQGFRQGIVDLYHAFPDLYTTTEDLVIDVESGTVVVRWTATGSHRQELLGIAPSGRRITFCGIEIIRVSDDRIVERWGEWDGLGLLEQLRSPGEG